MTLLLLKSLEIKISALSFLNLLSELHIFLKVTQRLQKCFQHCFWKTSARCVVANKYFSIMCRVVNHPLNICKFVICKTEYLQVQLLEQIADRVGADIDKILWKREKTGRRNSVL